MKININEIKYSNRIKRDLKDIELDGNESELKITFKDDAVEGEISLTFDEIRGLWAKLLEFDKTKAKEISSHFSENLMEANNLANRLSLDKYEDNQKKLEDMKSFVKIYSDLIEHAKFGIASQKVLKKEQHQLINEQQEQSKNDEEKKKKENFDASAKEISINFEKKFPREPIVGEAIELEEILRRQEEEKNKIKEDENKRMLELQKLAKEQEKIIKEVDSFTSSNTAKSNLNEQKNEIHINSDFNKVTPLFDEQNGLKKLVKRKSYLDKIDFSKL